MSASVAELPRWKCHKEVWAVKIREIRRDERQPTFKNAVCRGSFVLGSACGNCERCTYERELGPLKSVFLIVPEDAGVAPIPVNAAYVEKHKPVAGGYYVVYNDGYQSFSPAEAFEGGYTRV